MALILASVAFTQYAVFSWPPYFYIDKIGRRWTVILSSAGCAACMAIIAGCLLVKEKTTAATAVAFMFLFMDMFTLGILPVSWSYSAEIQPLRVRNKSTAVGVFSHWLSNFVVVMVTPIGLNNIGGNFFWIWGAVNGLFIPLTWFFGVETSGRTLEEIDELVCLNPFPQSHSTSDPNPIPTSIPTKSTFKNKRLTTPLYEIVPRSSTRPDGSRRRSPQSHALHA
jgi:MFS family permease